MEKDPESLIDRIKHGDDGAFIKLAEEYAGVTEGAVRRFLPSFDINAGDNPVYGIDDLRQCAALALYKAVQTYDPECGKDISFGLYAKICINNALISILRKYKSEQRRQKRAREKAEKVSNDPLYELINAENENELYSVIRAELSDFEKEVFDLYIVGKSAREIAERLGREEKSVSNALYRMKVKIKGLLKN